MEVHDIPVEKPQMNRSGTEQVEFVTFLARGHTPWATVEHLSMKVLERLKSIGDNIRHDLGLTYVILGLREVRLYSRWNAIRKWG